MKLLFLFYRRFLPLFAAFFLLSPNLKAGPVVMERDWLPAAVGSEAIRFYIADPTPHDFELALGGNLPVLWNGRLIPTQTALDPRFSDRLYLEFVVPPHLRTPGLIRFTLWDAANQRQTAHFGRVAVIFPTDSEVFEVSPANDRFVVYNAAEGSENGGRIDIYSLSSGALVDTVQFVAPQRVLTFTPDTIFVWLADDLAQGRLVRMNLWTREIDRTIQIGGPPPFDSIQAQVDRRNPELLIVRGTDNANQSIIAAYVGSMALPGIAPFSRPLPIATDDRGRYLFDREACRLDQTFGFAPCTTVADSRIDLLWEDKYLSNGSVYSLLSGEFLADISRQQFVYHRLSNRLVSGDSVVDGDTLETWAPSEVGFNIVRAQEPDWVTSVGYFLEEANRSVSGILATRLRALAPAPKFTANAIVHGAAFSTGGVAPGQIVSIFGENLGNEEGSLLTWEGLLELSTELDGVKVLFGGHAGTMLYAGPGQINVVAPGEIQGLPEVEVQVSRFGIPSSRIKVPVVNARPGLFAYTAANRRYAAALHLDGTVQGPSAPLERGAPVSLYGTGLGLPSGLKANRIADRAADTPIRPKITIGGRPAELLYSGTSPGLTTGLAQINVIVPPDSPVGAAVEVVIEAQGRREGNTWLAIR